MWISDVPESFRLLGASPILVVISTNSTNAVGGLDDILATIRESWHLLWIWCTQWFDLPPLFRVKEEPADAPCIEPELISLDDDDDGLNAIVHLFQSSSEPVSLLSPEPTSSEDMLQLLGSGCKSSTLDALKASGQSWEAICLHRWPRTTMWASHGRAICSPDSLTWRHTSGSPCRQWCYLRDKIRASSL